MTMAKKIVVIGLISAAVIAALFVVRYDQDVTANSRLFLACDTEGAWEGLERWRRRFSSSEFDLAAGKVYAKYFKSGDVGGGDAHQLPSNHIFREMRVINPVGKGRMAYGTAGASSLFGGKWSTRRGRTLGRSGEVVQQYGGDRFSVRSGRRFVVTKYRRTKGAK